MTPDMKTSKPSDPLAGGYRAPVTPAFAGINYSRVGLGGLAAGVLMIVIGFGGNGVLLGPRMQAEMAAAAPTLSRTPTPGAIVGAVITQLVVGLLLVWLYAAMRPRFGAGPGTAVKAASVVWLCGLLFYQDWVHAGIMQLSTYALASLVAFLSVFAGALIGARLYTEDAHN
jgi:hypothetical protein